jgi:hypothetical protein
LHLQDVDVTGAVTGKMKKNKDESANHANITAMWKISALYSSI